MDKLIAKSAAQGVLPRSYKSMTLTEVAHPILWALAPHKGKMAEAAAALKASFDITWPTANQTAGTTPRAQWFDGDHIMLMGAAPSDEILACCNATDHSDAWGVVQLSGAGAAQVLARLTPIDLRDGAFPIGATARTDVQHMAGAITRLADDVFEIMVFRSMTHTLIHDLDTAIKTVEAQMLTGV